MEVVAAQAVAEQAVLGDYTSSQPHDHDVRAPAVMTDKSSGVNHCAHLYLALATCALEK